VNERHEMQRKELDKTEWPFMAKVVYGVGLVSLSIVFSAIIIVILNKLISMWR